MTLRGRLLTGLLSVTAVGLAALSVVSVLVLRGHMLDRTDATLTTAAKASAARLVRASGIALVNVSPTYAVAILNLTSGRGRLVAGDDAEAGGLPETLERMGGSALGRLADSGVPFQLSDRLRGAAARMENGDRIVVVAVPLDEVTSAVRNLVATEVFTGLLLIGLLALLGRSLIGKGLAPLSRMASTAQLVAEGGDLSARMPEGKSEAGRLGAAVNVMLTRIQYAFAARWASEERVRRFAADASHELRNPLTTIHGYAELYRQGAIPDTEVPQVMRRIEDEAARMARLVSELLELARLDKGAPLAVAPADLTVLAREVVEDFASLTPDHPVFLDAPPKLMAVVDEARVRQVLVNLLANVRAHTPPGTSVRVRLGPPAVLEVSDDGPGMSPENAALAFDRFHHASPGDGSGLGLAIVQAIATAHGGHATLRSLPGRGTTVLVELPQHTPVPERAALAR
ncbi:HAMP domain-containing sensor histidine kinase [Sphaerisporangium sp. TRM90804]|uniref:sensor histidine kinase n=1 Tax=Sphaerisporangium sp. TRM90804 TaxID=3031113 RepID=UPI0024469E65|nr:HAMP domain-containing sensor histidine kinase [Sphaerisporangium sp. TRM90804]MDH2427070.1 HAMP domain-containing sensor histidine kinase [Sphaerisporangium sp. TRM90804]